MTLVIRRTRYLTRRRQLDVYMTRDPVHHSEVQSSLLDLVRELLDGDCHTRYLTQRRQFDVCLIPARHLLDLPYPHLVHSLFDVRTYPLFDTSSSI